MIPMSRWMRAATVFAFVLGFVIPGFAHHGVAWYDYSKTVTAKDVTVTEFDWTNPHCIIRFSVTDARQNIQHWTVEMHPPDNLVEHGWTRQTLRSGDVVTISFRPSKNGSASGLLEEVVLPNGVALRQNVLLLPAGETMSLQEWTRRFGHKVISTPPAPASSAH